MIGLVNGSNIEVPNLDKPILQAIFAAHEKHLEQETVQKNPLPSNPIEGQTMIRLPLNFGIEGLEQMGTLLQHNSDAADTPDLPPEMLEKVASLAKVMGFENSDTIPQAEPHCNCMHCQIMRALHAGEEAAAAPVQDAEEEVSASDLTFREWDIAQSADKLYTVTNPLNRAEHYNVYLGTPIGCTCGEKNCEHIRAVLNT